MEKKKLVALALLAAVSLLMPVVETLMTGRVESFSAYDLAGSFVSLIPIFWWYHLDKAQHNYRAGPLMNAGMAALAGIALPVYFIRSRGWRRGAIAIAIALGVLGALYLIELLGESIGRALAGMMLFAEAKA